MNLESYIKKHKIEPADYEKTFGVSPTTVWRILNNKFIPRPKTAETIEKKTGGKVSRMELLYPNK